MTAIGGWIKNWIFMRARSSFGASILQPHIANTGIMFLCPLVALFFCSFVTRVCFPRFAVFPQVGENLSKVSATLSDFVRFVFFLF